MGSGGGKGGVVVGSCSSVFPRTEYEFADAWAIVSARARGVVASVVAVVREREGVMGVASVSVLPARRLLRVTRPPATACACDRLSLPCSPCIGGGGGAVANASSVSSGVRSGCDGEDWDILDNGGTKYLRR